MAEERTDVAALFARLKEEVRAAGPRDGDVTPAQVRLSVRDQAERLWAVSAERPIVGKGGPVKLFLRRFMRWYVEPAFADQRAFNDAVAEADRRPRRAHRPARAEMRIAVCRPQVPFVYGGAEVVADQLVDELRARGHEAELVAVPYKWYPGTRVLDQAFLWRLLDLSESDGKPIELVIATKFPSYGIRHPNKVVVARAPVPAGLRLRPHRVRPVLGVAGGPRDAARGRAVRPGRARRGAPDLHDLAATSPTGCSATRASTRRCCRRRRRQLAYRTDELERLRALGQPARPRQADRPADRGGEARARAAHRDRRRRARPRAARAARRRAERPGRVRRAASTTSGSPTSTRAASPSTTRRSTRTTGWSRTRRSCPRSPS